MGERSGPYIVTTKRQDPDGGVAAPDGSGWTPWPTVSRRAVVTLEEARRSCVSRVAKCALDAGATSGYWPHEADAKTLPESGGTIGPLPDGTVIEVEQADVGRLWAESGLTHLVGSSSRAPSLQGILDAWNEKHTQEARA